MQHYIFSYKVNKEHPYSDPPQPSDPQADCYMALLRCAGGNPARLLNLRDDECIIYKETTGVNYCITLAGEEPMVKLTDLARTVEGRAYIMSVLDNCKKLL